MASDTLTGRMMGAYQLTRRLGRGGMASVYLAYDQKLQREVAVKVLLGIDAADEHFSARFQQEALATAQLDHPNIIHIYDYGREGDLIYMVMEYCPNGSLLDVLTNASKQGQPIDPDYTIQVISQIASALDFAHQRGIIHRDIKPSNILFARDGRPVLADLGIAKALAGPRLTHTHDHHRHARIHVAGAGAGRDRRRAAATSIRWAWCCMKCWRASRPITPIRPGA